MSAGLIRHLKRKTEEDSNTRILMSQWEFDEKLVGKSLENVGSYYPHFSSHNESHSQQILVNIERLLGSNIEKLTATDTWLILEAAYWHDIGMLFNADEVQTLIHNEEFKDYVENIANNNAHDLHNFAKVWVQKGWKVALVEYDNPYVGVEKYRQMVADWYRGKHQDNSRQVVLKPFEKLGISSPRTELLPQRIYSYLAQICLSHGEDFNNYIMRNIPFRQTGMGIEDCHPRFVACLLRLGDLFDIDDNRFCPVMAKQVSNMPAYSEVHKDKHQAIREFQLDSDTVSVTAECSTEMSYIECQNWFGWIREEIQNQMSQWKNIVPSRDFGLLPTINKLDVKMTNSKILINNKPMKFSLDERSAIELLQGNNLYKDDMSVYRELIQNAIDATMLRVWLDFGEELISDSANPYDFHTHKIFSEYPITLDCKKINDNRDSTLWQLSIHDNGIGITRKDLEYMQKIAGSKNNKEKKKIIRDMPEWMRPSGEFGIGLHSAFLLMKNLDPEKQKITIITKSRLTHESLKIELNSPLSGKRGYCFIEKIKDLDKYGTTIYLPQEVINEKKYEDLNLSDLARYEGLVPRNLNYLKNIVSIKNKIRHPLVSITYTESLKPFEVKSKNHPKELSKFYWNKENNTALSIFFKEEKEKIRNSLYDISTIKFRGQTVDNIDYFGSELKLPQIFGMGGLSFIIDIYSTNASEVININRESINNKELVRTLIIDSYKKLLKEIKNNNSEVINKISDEPRKLSFILKFNTTDLIFKNNENWKDVYINEDNTIFDTLSSEVFTNQSRHRNEDRKSILEKDLNTPQVLLTKSELMQFLLDNKFFQIELKENGFKRFLYTNEKESFYLYSKKDLKSLKFSIKEVSYDYSNYIHNSIEGLYRMFDKKTLPMGWFDIAARLDESEIERSFLPSTTKEMIASIFRKEGLEPFIIIPFIKIKNDIVVISNNTLIEYSDISVENEVELEEIYTNIKTFIISDAKNNNKKWYNSYQRGLKFRAIDLSAIDKAQD